MKQAQTRVRKKATESTGAQRIDGKVSNVTKNCKIKIIINGDEKQSLKERKDMESAHVISKCE